MTIGYVLLVIGALEIVWMIWGIRTYDPNRVSKIETVLHDITRTKMRPKTKLGILIERSSYWYGLFVGLVLVSLGLIFVNME